MTYFIRSCGRKFGPYDESQLVKMKNTGRIGRATKVSNDGSYWQPAEAFPFLYSSVGSTSVLVPSNPPGFTDMPSLQKEEKLPVGWVIVACLLLLFIVGGIGLVTISDTLVVTYPSQRASRQDEPVAPPDQAEDQRERAPFLQRLVPIEQAVNQVRLTTAEQAEIDKFCRELGVDEKTVDVRETVGDGTTLLHLAAAKWGVPVAQFLVSKGANVNAKDEDGETPLDWAKHWGNTLVAEYLADNGGVASTRVQAANSRGRNPLVGGFFDMARAEYERQHPKSNDPKFAAADEFGRNMVFNIMESSAENLLEDLFDPGGVSRSRTERDEAMARKHDAETRLQAALNSGNKVQEGRARQDLLAARQELEIFDTQYQDAQNDQIRREHNEKFDELNRKNDQRLNELRQLNDRLR
jgi:hypothetical protein